MLRLLLAGINNASIVSNNSLISTSCAYDAANRLLSATAGGDEEDYESDADGNTLSDGTHTNTWDSQNRLRECDAIDATSPNTTHHCGYTYGADGLRRSQSVIDSTQAVALNTRPITAPSAANVTDYAYDGTMLVREMQTVSGTLTPTATYLQGPGGPMYRRDDTQSEGTYTSGGTTYAAGKTRWYVYDGLGSVVGEVDPSGDLTSSGTFDVYGAKRSGGSTGTATTKQGFVGQCGHVTDTETGLIYMRARYYDPSTGRFVSEDPSRNGPNWFTYCENNSVNCVDNTGKHSTYLENRLEAITPNFNAFDLGVALSLAAIIVLTSTMSWLSVAAGTALALAAIYAFAIGGGNTPDSALNSCIKDYAISGWFVALMDGEKVALQTATTVAGGMALLAVVAAFSYTMAILGACAWDDCT